jgi:hypothetical protein
MRKMLLPEITSATSTIEKFTAIQKSVFIKSALEIKTRAFFVK